MAKFSTLSSGVSRWTSCQRTASSSAITCASEVPMCWPISAFTMCIVTLPSGVRVNQIEGVKLVMAALLAASARLPGSRAGNPILKNAPPAVAAERTRNSRRVAPVVVALRMDCALLHDFGGTFHSGDNARVGGAATEVAVHRLDDLRLARIRIGRQQRRGLHDLARLTVTA